MAEFLNKAVKLVLVAGPKLRVGKAQKAFVELADACGYPIAVMPSGKRLVPEHHPHFFGTYWGVMCTSYCGEIVESADAYVFVGPIFNDYSSFGYSLLIKKETSVIVQPKRVTIGNGPLLDWIFMVDFLTALAKELKKNITANKNYCRIFVPPGIALERENNEPLRDNMLFKDVQKMLGGDTAVIAETGDLWFSGDTAAPSSCTLWVTAQDISMMIGCGHRSIIFLIDNGGYTIDVEIHDGPYNVIIKMWKYTGLVDAIHYGDGCYSQWGRQMLDYQVMLVVTPTRKVKVGFG